MIVSCPNCDARYTVGAAAVRAEGRKVRCARCGHTWYQRPVAEDDVGATLGMDGVTQMASPPPSRTKGKAAAKGKAKGAGGGRKLRVGWIAFGATAVAVVAGGVLAREPIVALWPPAALLYSTLHIPVEPPGAGLELRELRSERKADGIVTVLMLEGQIVNSSDTQRRVPVVHATALGHDEAALQSWTIEASHAELLPGEVATFQFMEPGPANVARVKVSFGGE